MNDLLSYETARVLQIIIGSQVFRETEYVYEYHSKERHKRTDATFSELLFINCPTGSDLLNAIPHTTGGQDSCLALNKHLSSWKAYYISTAKESRASQSYTGNNLAEILAKLWLDTCSVNVGIYDQASVLVNLLDYCYPSAETIQLTNEFVRYSLDGDIRTVHKLSLAKYALIKFKATV